MGVLKLTWRSLQGHAMSTLAAVVSLALGISLMTVTVTIREQTHRRFTRIGLGVDAVVGPKGSPLQIVLNAVYHLEEMPGKIPWPLIEELRQHPVVAAVIPFCSGHSYAGLRVNAIDADFFRTFEIQPGRTLTFDPAAGGQGRPFASGPVDEAVAGWEAARQLGLKLGDTFNPTCGVNLGDPVHTSDTLRFVGIFARTGTPHDRAIYIPLERFYTLGGHGQETAQMAVDLEHREVSGALLSIRKIRGGLLHPGLRDLAFALNQNPAAQLVIPNEVLPRLFSIIGWVDQVMIGLAGLVVAMATLFLGVALLNALRERRREYALLRCLGASPGFVASLIQLEAGFTTAVGTVLGWIIGRGLVVIAVGLIKAETGVDFDAWSVSWFDVALLPAALLASVGIAAIPTWQAYRISPLENLLPTW